MAKRQRMPFSRPRDPGDLARPGACLALVALAICGLAGALPATALAGDDACLTTQAPPAGPGKLRFGITPGIAGSAGSGQGQAAPVDPASELRALRHLRSPKTPLVVRLNRLFWADGRSAIRAFAHRAHRYARAGMRSEIQVRYHPPEGHEGDIRGWLRFVRHAVRRLGAIRSVAAFSITNEINFPISANTSDGAYEGAPRALVRGVEAADRVLRRLGRPRVQVGFTVAWRYIPQDDADLWRQIGALGGKRFRRALDYVGVQAYPGLVWPPAPLPGRSAGTEVVEALTLIRDCYMPMAGIGRHARLWVSENGYPTRPALESEAGQSQNLVSTVQSVAAVARTLRVTDYRYFNLRDNDSDGADLFATVGLMRDDYSPKIAFATYRDLIKRLGK